MSISSLITPMNFIPMGVIIVFVVTLSVLAEVLSPRVAGVLSGFPLGGATALFFMGLEISPRFAAESALHASAGIVAILVFTYCYYRGSVLSRKLGRVLQILCACLVGMAGYLAAACVLSFVPGGFLPGFFLPILAILVFARLFKGVENSTIGKRVNMMPGVLLLRALFAACTVTFIISIARMLGPTWAGLFSAFPHIILPLVVIIQFTYDAEHAYAILKNVPKGIVSLVIYCLTVSFGYPVYGIYAGTALGYAMATAYLIAVEFHKPLLKKNRPGAQDARQ